MKAVSYLMSHSQLEDELNQLPDSELKVAIKAWQNRQRIAIGPMSLSGIYYRSNLQYILEHIDKAGLIDELNTYGSAKVKEYGQLVIKYGAEFKRIFGVALTPYMDLFTGFRITQFDSEVIHSPDGKSMQDVISECYGEEAVRLLKRLF
jgi:hypothetical protein